MKYYAVKLGRQTGIFETWGEAEAQVKGFPNAKFKSFSSFEEAKSYLEDSNQSQSSNLVEYEVYVDGSFDRNTNTYGSGVVITKENEVIKKISFSGSDEKYIESYQIAGEVKAALRAMEWAIDNHISRIAIFYDYEGIKSWAVGEWKTNKSVSRDYKVKYDSLSSQVKVYFNKVKAHSGVKFNELADQLAKRAIKEGDSNTNDNLSDNQLGIEFYNYLISSDENNKKDNIIYYNEFMISDKKILKFIKNIWKQEGKKVGEIKNISYKLNFNSNILSAKIEAKESKNYEIKF